jgi:hypothetical protein
MDLPNRRSLGAQPAAYGCDPAGIARIKRHSCPVVSLRSTTGFYEPILVKPTIDFSLFSQRIA